MVSIPSTGDRVSRWTPAIFVCAFINFVAAQVLIVAGISWPAAPETSGATLATVHLLTIGWITLLMFGALFQFVPVLTSRKLWSQTLSAATLLLIELGLAGMVAGFFQLGTSLGLLLPAGGSLVIAGILAGGINLGVPLARKHPLPLGARFIIAGLVLLLLTVGLGLSFALAFTVPALAPMLGSVVASGVEYHMLAGIGGWFTLIAIGVSYELLPMFMLAPHDRGVVGRVIFWTAVAGFAAALCAGLCAPVFHSAVVPGIEQAGRAAIAAACALYLIDIARLYRDRRRRQIELHNRAAIGAFASLGVTLAVAVGFAVIGDLGRIASSLLVLLIFGWLSGLGLTQLYKIVPFLAWLSHFGRRLGTGPVPRVQDLVDEHAAAKMFVAYFVAVAFAVVGTFLGLPLLVRAAMGVTLLQTLLLGREYWRAWQGYYVRRQTPVVTSSTKEGAGHERAGISHA